MKKSMTLAVAAALMLSSCGSYTGAGAYTGTTLGSVLGSAIGGIADGPRGSDIGTIVGMAGGAAVGAAIGNAADKKAQAEVTEHREAVKARRAQEAQQQRHYGDDTYSPGYSYPADTAVSYRESGAANSGFDPNNGGDDRIYDFGDSESNGSASAQQAKETMPLSSSVDDLIAAYKYTPNIEIRHARFIDANEDGKIVRGELCKVVFEVINRGQSPLYDVVPVVIETTGMKHLYISPSMHVEKIDPGKGIRYTALIKADNHLKEGVAKICVSVVQGGKAISKVSEFNIPTVKK